jgi:hypothetical protein
MPVTHARPHAQYRQFRERIFLKGGESIDDINP